MPKKQKKRGGGKTEEEKLLYLQQRAQAEEEQARKKEEMLTLFLKEKLLKEQRNSGVNLLKLNETWRTILRRTRAVELQRDVFILSRTCERQLDSLDGVIKSLEGDLQEAERQSAQVNRRHLQNLECLWAQQDQRLRFLQQQWENSLQQLSSRFSCKRKQMQAMSQQHRGDLDNAEFIMGQRFKEMVTEMDILYRVRATKLQHTPAIGTTSPSHACPGGRNPGKNQGRNAGTPRRQQDLQVLDQVTAELKQLVLKDKVQAAESQSFILQMKRMMRTSRKEHEAAERDLTDARDEVKRKTRMLRDQLTRGQAAARKRLSDLTVHSSNSTKKLQDVIDKGERLLRIAEMCRRLETEQETSSWSSSATADDQSQDRCATQEEQEKERPEFPELQQVMWRTSAAVLQREALRRRRAELSRENRQLKLLLRQRLDAVDGPNALLTVSQAPTVVTPADASRHHTVIEAAHAVKHSL